MTFCARKGNCDIFSSVGLASFLASEEGIKDGRQPEWMEKVEASFSLY